MGTAVAFRPFNGLSEFYIVIRDILRYSSYLITTDYREITNVGLNIINKTLKTIILKYFKMTIKNNSFAFGYYTDKTYACGCRMIFIYIACILNRVAIK